MKKLAAFAALSGVLFIAGSCNSAGDKKSAGKQDTVAAVSPKTEEPGKTAKFDITTIPVSQKELGAFPFFTLPRGLKAQNGKPLQREFDRLFFPIDGIFQPVEGKMWKATLVPENDGAGSSWSLPYFEKSYDDAITAAGGVKVYEGKVSQSELDRIDKQATYFGETGSLDYWNVPVKIYVIRRPQGDDVYIQLSGNSAGGEVQILQKQAFKQTITAVKADKIQEDLSQKGKSVLYINFDTDKATLKADGNEAVAEIAKALSADNALKISINGYTDNAGNEKHNLELSKQRAETVKAQLVKAGIAAARLSTQGFGQNDPVTDNNSDEGKAKNRRVELVKVK